MIQIPDIDNVNHIVVFMTGEMPFPEGYAGAVYFNYMIDGEQRWIYLGKLSNKKPSSIFKIANLKHADNHVSVTPFGLQSTESVHHTSAMIGISVEPLINIDALTPATSTSANNDINSFLDYTQKMLENFYNYSASFVKDGGDGVQYVPFTCLQNWYSNFKRRLELNPNFWKNS
jgi:hypothetical protein